MPPKSRPANRKCRCRPGSQAVQAAIGRWQLLRASVPSSTIHGRRPARAPFDQRGRPARRTPGAQAVKNTARPRLTGFVRVLPLLSCQTLVIGHNAKPHSEYLCHGIESTVSGTDPSAELPPHITSDTCVCSLFYPTVVHADVVVGLACALRMSCDAGVIIVATQFAAILRLCRRCRMAYEAIANQRQQSGKGSHDNSTPSVSLPFSSQAAW